jgi:SpoVK/Ycf46/Vps4 family AAA+-type ATPase
MSRALVKQAKKLYDRASRKSQLIGNASGSFISSLKPNPKSFKAIMKKLSETLATILEEDQKRKEEDRKIDTDDPDIREFLKFVIEHRQQESKFECSPPLAPGDLSFNDIAGQQETKQRLSVSYILPFDFPHLFKSLGKGTLLYGVPGTGKSLLAKATVNEIEDAAFFNVSPADIKGKYEGETEKNIQKWFKCAQEYVENESNKARLAIIFFDEFDAIASMRGEDESMKRTVNMLLQMMDGIDSSPYVSVLAATNYPSSIDDAILRRFTNRIFIDIPDEQAREYIIRETLADYYSNPLYTKKQIRTSIWTNDKHTDFNEGANFITEIKTYGQKKSETIQTGRLFGQSKSVTKSDRITNSVIKDLVGRFGPNSDGRNIIENVASVSDDDKRLNKPHIFGYSPSDIRKVMEIAISTAAMRTMEGYARKHEFYRKGKSGQEIGDPEEFYVFDPDLQEQDGNDTVKISEITDKNIKERLLNFDIRLADVLSAMESYPSTIDNEKYLYLLKYSKQLI